MAEIETKEESDYLEGFTRPKQLSLYHLKTIVFKPRWQIFIMSCDIVRRFISLAAWLSRSDMLLFAGDYG